MYLLVFVLRIVQDYERDVIVFQGDTENPDNSRIYKSLLKNGASREAEKLLKRAIDESMDFQLLRSTALYQAKSRKEC